MKSSSLSIFDTYPLLKEIAEDKFPNHVLIIPDGNGRWAKKHHKFTLVGHKKGAQVIMKILTDLSALKKISIVTIWCFSADNWKRSEKEVTGIFFLIEHIIHDVIADLKQRNIRFVHLGRKDRLPKPLFQIIETAEKETGNNKGQILCVAIDFGGEDQEIRIIEKAKMVPKNTPVSNDLLWQLRDGKGLIKPADLLMRTAGEKRTSDIGWLNGAPTELYFIDKLFPDITTGDIVEALFNFSKRERRFGARK